jgi:hypothetical protein
MARQLLDTSQPEPCFSDGLGARYIRTLATGETVEALRLRPELAQMRESIRDRMTRLASFRQASFLPVRDTAAVLHQPGCLEVVSDYVPGVRLSTILEAARTRRMLISTTAALHVVRGLLGALAVLAESRTLAHGAVGPERVLLTSKGRLIVTDYVYGLALERLEYSQRKLWREFRIALPSGVRTPSVDARADLLQVGLVAVALLLGRPLDIDEFPGQIPALAESLRLPFEGDRRGGVERGVKVCVGRLLETDAGKPFSGAREALSAIEAALAPQRQASGQANPIRLLVNSYALAMAGPDAGPILAPEPPDAPPAIQLHERPSLDGDFTREIQVESIAQPPEIFEAQGTGPGGASARRRRKKAAASEDRADAAAEARASRRGRDAVRRVVSGLAGFVWAGFVLPIRACRAAGRAASAGAGFTVAATTTTLGSVGGGVRSLLLAGLAGAAGVAKGALRVGMLPGRLLAAIGRALRWVVIGAIGLARSSVRGVGTLARSSGRGAAAVVRSTGRGADTLVRSSGRGAGGAVRAAVGILDAAGGVVIRSVQAALRGLMRAGRLAVAMLSAVISASGGGVRAAASAACEAAWSFARTFIWACVRVSAGVARRAGRGAVLLVRVTAQAAVRGAASVVRVAVQAAGRAGRATVRTAAFLLGALGSALRAAGVWSGRGAVGTMWLVRKVSAALGRMAAALSQGAAALGQMLRRRAWPAGVAAMSTGARLTVSAARAARLGAVRLNPKPELRLQLLASTLVVLVMVYGIQLVKAHWNAGVAVTAQLSNTVTSGIKRVDLKEWWPAGQRGAQALAGSKASGRAQQAPALRSIDFGSLNVSSTPDGAEVWLDGDIQGRAPITLEEVPAGDHTLMVRGRTGSVRRSVHVQAGGTADVAISIQAGWLVVFAPIGMAVIENGRAIGTSETGRMLLNPGEHRLDIVNEQVGFRESHTPEIRPGETVAINVQLPPAMLEITAPADTEVLVDGQLIAKTPTEPVPVAVGTREVILRHPSLGEQRQTATITYRTPNRVQFRLPG